MEDKTERRANWNYQTVEVCEERHKVENQRWQTVQATLDRVERSSSNLSKVAFTILGGLIVALILLALNLALDKYTITHETPNQTFKSSPSNTP